MSAAKTAVKAVKEVKERPHQTGHRDRLRRRFCKTGGEAMPDYEMIELILFNIIPRRDVKLLAKKIAEKCGGFAGALTASSADMTRATDLPPKTVERLMMEFTFIRAAAERLAREQVMDRPVLSSWQALLRYLRIADAHKEIEELRVLFLNQKNILIADEVMQRGTVNHTPVYIREIVHRILELGATSIILVHNHPSGDATPSHADIEMTRQLANAVSRIEVKIHDHLVMARGGHVSFREQGLMRDMVLT